MYHHAKTPGPNFLVELMYHYYLGSKSGLDKVADGHGADEAGETRDLGFLLVRTLLEHPEGVEARHLSRGLCSLESGGRKLNSQQVESLLSVPLDLD